MILKMSDSDLQLLARFTERRNEDAFAELVHRHLGLVYSAALRQVRSPQLAEEVAQSAFTDLARSAPHLAPDTILTAWLYQVTRRTAIDVVRREARRQLREQIATEMNALHAPASDWMHIEPLLDEAMQALDDTDRTAVLLRYFENKSLREVGQMLGTSEDAAQKQVSRAVERLREFLAQRGVTSTASALSLLLSANAIQAAPIGLATAISTAAALAGTVSVTAATAIATGTEALAMTAPQKVIIAAVVIASVVMPMIVRHQLQSRLLDQDRALRQQADQLAQLQAENLRLSNQLASIRNRTSSPNDSFNELLRWRSQVGTLSREVRDLSRRTATGPAAGSNLVASLEQMWSGRVSQLKQWLEDNPSEKIPELRLLSDRDWLDGIYPHKLETGEEFQRAMRILRANAEMKPIGVMHQALRQYAQENGGQFPSAISQLKPFLKTPLDDAILERYEIVRASDLIPELRPGGDWVITQKAPVNATLDIRYAFDGTNARDADETFTNRWRRAP